MAAETGRNAHLTGVVRLTIPPVIPHNSITKYSTLMSMVSADTHSERNIDGITLATIHLSDIFPMPPGELPWKLISLTP